MPVALDPVADGAVVVVAVVLFIAGLMKIAAGPVRFRESALGALFPSPALALAGWIGLSLCEISLVLGLVAFRGSSVPLVLANLFFFAAFVYLVWALHRRSDRPCGCFGVASGPVSRADALRAGFLAILASLALVAGGAWPPLDGRWGSGCSRRRGSL